MDDGAGRPAPGPVEELHRRWATQGRRLLLSSLLPDLTHQLSNSIGLIFGNVEFAEQYLQGLLELVAVYEAGPLPEETRARAEAVRDQLDLAYLRDDAPKVIRALRIGGERLAAQIREVKAFLQPESMPHTFDLTACVQQVSRLMAPILRDRVRVQNAVAPHHPLVACPPPEITHMLCHLVMNGVQAIEGQGTVSVGLSSGPTMVRIMVTDSGSGVSSEALPHLFEPFFSTRGRPGLGLTLTRLTAERYGGRALHEAGTPSTFVLELPIATRRP